MGRFRRYACVRNPHILQVCCGFSHFASLELASYLLVEGEGVRSAGVAAQSEDCFMAAAFAKPLWRRTFGAL